MNVETIEEIQGPFQMGMYRTWYITFKDDRKVYTVNYYDENPTVQEWFKGDLTYKVELAKDWYGTYDLVRREMRATNFERRLLVDLLKIHEEE